jgi:hypothetical protein
MIGPYPDQPNYMTASSAQVNMFPSNPHTFFSVRPFRRRPDAVIAFLQRLQADRGFRSGKTDKVELGCHRTQTKLPHKKGVHFYHQRLDCSSRFSLTVLVDRLAFGSFSSWIVFRFQLG